MTQGASCSRNDTGGRALTTMDRRINYAFSDYTGL